MKIQRSLDTVHPILKECINRIQKEIIDTYSMPIRIFETGRDHERHQTLIQRGLSKDIMSCHLYNLENDPPLYTTAIDYVYFLNNWSWNLRDSTITSWYNIFGNLVLDICPELKWGAQSRKSVNYCHFELRDSTILENIDKFPCVVRK